MRENIEKCLRIALLLMSSMAMAGPGMLGVGMMFISMIFCDSGPFQKCVDTGLMLMGGLLFCAALPVPALIMLIRNRRSLGWYMYVYPFLMLGLAGVTYHFAAPLGMAKFAYEYAFLALGAFVYVVLRHTGAKHAVPASEPPALPPVR